MNVIDKSCWSNSSNEHLLHRSPWRQYRDFVRNNGVSLGLLEDILNQLIFWMPQNSRDDNQWREILYGLLSLHRMATDVANQHEDGDDQRPKPEFFGTTVEVEMSAPILLRILSPPSMRMAITVIHNLLPTILQLSSRRDQRPRVRFWLEQAKFLLRLVLLGSYWYQLYDNQELESGGLLMGGGMMMTTTGPNGAVGITVAQAQAWRHRQDYVGRRTGRTVAKSVPTLTPSKSMWPLMLGEILHLYRPLHWAGVEQARVPTLLDWAGILGMDVLSLLLLERFKHSALNSQELRRRKLKLFLYLLRGPVFDKFTGPAASRAFRITGMVPLVGPLLESYFWEWLLYWKHPFASELD